MCCETQGKTFQNEKLLKTYRISKVKFSENFLHFLENKIQADLILYSRNGLGQRLEADLFTRAAFYFVFNYKLIACHHNATVSWLVEGCGNPVVKVSDHGRYVMSSGPVPLKPSTSVGVRCSLNLSRAQMSSRWCGS
ncbi:hypothetical protein TNCV_37321 [Trichonephila clavipes]|nr:hypothetical protein TNCV_37321 [Trichonephila clavipes]